MPKAQLDAIEDGNYDNFIDYLEAEGLQPSQDAFLRLSWGAEEAMLPPGLIQRIREW